MFGLFRSRKPRASGPPPASVPFPYSLHVADSKTADVLSCGACHSRYGFHRVTGEWNGTYMYSRFGNLCALIAGPHELIPKAKAEFDFLFRVHGDVFKPFEPWTAQNCPHCGSSDIAVAKAEGGKVYTISF